MSEAKLREIVLIILEDEQGRVAMQLRSDIAGIVNPGRWGIFGGHMETGEEPAQAAQREVEEELTCDLVAGKLRFWRTLERKDLIYHLFHYPVAKELDDAELTEGERFEFLWPSQVYIGAHEGHEIVDYHLAWLTDFWEDDGA